MRSLTDVGASELDHLVVSYALFGVVAREQRHTTANLLAVVQGWGAFLTTHADAPSVGSGFLHAADAVERLSRLERALQRCCEGLADTDVRAATIHEIANVVQDLSQASRAASGTTWDLVLPTKEALIRGRVGELAVALTGMVRLASVDACHVTLTVECDPLAAASPMVRFRVIGDKETTSTAGFKAKPPRLLGVELSYAAAVATAFGGRLDGPAVQGTTAHSWQTTLSVPCILGVTGL